MKLSNILAKTAFCFIIGTIFSACNIDTETEANIVKETLNNSEGDLQTNSSAYEREYEAVVDQNVHNNNQSFEKEQHQVSTAEEISRNYYSVVLKNTSKIQDLPWAETLSFDIVQVRDMPEAKIQVQCCANANIEESMTSWLKGSVLDAKRVDLVITCTSSRYLSFVNEFWYEGKNAIYIYDCITIDMLTGERVQLHDLVEVDEDFVAFLQSNEDIVLEAPNPFWQSPLDLARKYSSAELLEALNECSYPLSQRTYDSSISEEQYLPALTKANSFFVREGILVIVLFGGGEKRFVTLDVDDIEHFLLVDKW